jgi:hypothetical protein
MYGTQIYNWLPNGGNLEENLYNRHLIRNNPVNRQVDGIRRVGNKTDSGIFQYPVLVGSHGR